MINKKIHCLSYKSVLDLVPNETVSDHIIAEIDGH
jgi:hypothetical protein